MLRERPVRDYRMDILSIIGIIIGFSAILGGNYLEGGSLEWLLNGPAIVIVLGGTVGAIMLQTPIRIFIRALKLSGWVFMPPPSNAKRNVRKILNWSEVARREGLLGLEAMADSERDLFSRKGLQLLVDGTEPDAIRAVMEHDLDVAEHRDMQAARVYEGMGGYSPTIGIIGAVMGLIHVMQNLADPSRLGVGIATAFVATIYGIGLANLLFLPFATKLKSQVQQQIGQREMIVEGIVSIAEGENPRNIETKLRGFIT